jgi:hypothetical protein
MKTGALAEASALACLAWNAAGDVSADSCVFNLVHPTLGSDLIEGCNPASRKPEEEEKP